MRNNSQTNNLLKWGIIIADFLLLNALLLLCALYYPKMDAWTPAKIRLFSITLNVALLISHYYNSPIIHRRVVSVGDIFQRIIRLDAMTVVVAYIIMKGISLSQTKVGTQLMTVGAIYLALLLVSRFIERNVIKLYRQKGGNRRVAIFVGADPELFNIYDRLIDDASKGYRIAGYYADQQMADMPKHITLRRLGTMDDLLRKVKDGAQMSGIDEVYVCVSRKEGDTIRRISNYCDQNVIRFYYVPVSVETLGINLKRELLDDIEVYTTYENPLLNPVNKLVKRTFDVVVSAVLLVCLLPCLPIIWLIIRMQSPGPLFFTQARTGLDGKEFRMYKFRSMHVNADADRLQATADDPRKYPFGNFMRRANIDELPQFWNVLCGDMSIVGPRPHMLLHTEQYSRLIDKYMVRHFVKPGVTGWAQVTGFRGETKEVWQMEGRVKRDIWYMEHWSIWLDIRIIWMTVKTIFVHDEQAY